MYFLHILNNIGPNPIHNITRPLLNAWILPKFSVPNTKKRKLSGEEDRQTPTKNEIVFLQGNNDNNDNENGESRSPVPTQQQQLQNKNHRNSPQATTTLFNVQHSPPIATH